MIITLYVGDLQVIGSNVLVIETINNKLEDNFQMSDLGDVSLVVLGMQVTRDCKKKERLPSLRRITPSPFWHELGWRTASPRAYPEPARSYPRSSRPRLSSTRSRLKGFKLSAFSDANWGNNPDNGKSTSVYLVMLSKAPISFKSGIQSLTAMSTM